MLELRSCLKSEHKSALNLSIKTFKGNMAEQFQLLLGEQNTDRIFVASDDGQVVSMVNYYPATVRLNNFTTKVGSIGSVCTNENYRKQSLASRLLVLVEKKMLEENIRIAIISGDIYNRFGSKKVGNVVARIVNRNSLKDKKNIELLEYSDQYFDEIYNIYQKEALCFLRTKDEFELLLKSQTYPDTFADYPIILVFSNHQLMGYIIVNRTFGKRTLLVKEYVGNREAIVDAIPVILKQYKKFNLTILADPSDSINLYLESVPSQMTDLYASLKIVDFLGLMMDLKPYIDYKLSDDEIQKFRYGFEDNHYFFQCQESSKLVLDIYQLNQLILGPSVEIIDLALDEELAKILSKLFPIPFVWVNNLNYQ
jgi:predicted acetyltransferase